MTSEELLGGAVPARRGLFASPPVRNGVHLGLSFCAVFMAFSVSQNFQTSSDHKEAGSTALGILYACFTFSNFVAASIVSALRPKLCLILGSLTYVGFVAANIHYNMIALYISSGFLGVGASVLWTAQGAYISNCAALHEQAEGLPPSSTLGVLNGIFFAIFQSNQLLGNLLAAALFKANVQTGTIFIVMTAICACGAMTLLGLNDPAKAPSTAEHAAATASASSALTHAALDQSPNGDIGMASASPSYSDSSLRSDALSNTSELHYIVAVPPPRQRSGFVAGALRVLAQIFSALQLLTQIEMLVLVPIMIYSGLSQTYIFGAFPPLIEDRSTKFFVLATIGATDAVSSVVMGKLSDKYGRVLVLAIGFLTAGSAILFLSFWHVSQADSYVFFLVGVVMGVSDGVFNTQIYVILGTWFEGRTEQAFANFKLFQAGSTAVAFLLDHSLGFKGKCVLTGSWLVAGMVCLAVCDLAARARGLRGSVLDGAYGAKNQGLDLPDATSPMLSPSDHGSYGAPEFAAQAYVNGDAKAKRANSLNLDSRGAYTPAPDLFPNAGHSVVAFSQQQTQSQSSEQMSEPVARPTFTAATRRRSSTHMQRTPPPAMQQQQMQMQTQAQQQQAMPSTAPIQPILDVAPPSHVSTAASRATTPLPPLHPGSSAPSPAHGAVVSSALLSARMRLSGGSSGARSKEVSPAPVAGSWSGVDKENAISMPSTPEPMRLGAEYLSPLRFPGMFDEPTKQLQSSGPVAPVSATRAMPITLTSISASPLAVSLAPNAAASLGAQSPKVLSAVPLAGWSTPVRPVLGASRRQSQGLPGQTPGVSTCPRVEALKERVATALKNKQKQAAHAITPAPRPSSTSGAALSTPSYKPSAFSTPSVDDIMSPMASVSLTPYSRATEQAVAADMDGQGHWVSLLDRNESEDNAAPIAEPASATATAAVASVAQDAPFAPMPIEAAADAAMLVHEELAPVHEETDETMHDASDRTAPVPVAADATPATPRAIEPATTVAAVDGIAAMLLPGSSLRSGAVAPLPPSQPLPLSVSFSPATVRKRERAQFSRDLIASITSPAQVVPVEADRLAESPAPVQKQQKKSDASNDAAPQVEAVLAPAPASVPAPVQRSSSWSFATIAGLFMLLALVLGGCAFGASFHLASPLQSRMAVTSTKITPAVPAVRLTEEIELVTLPLAVPVAVAPVVPAVEPVLAAPALTKAEPTLPQAAPIAEPIVPATPVTKVDVEVEVAAATVVAVVESVPEQVAPLVVPAPIVTAVVPELVVIVEAPVVVDAPIQPEPEPELAVASAELSTVEPTVQAEAPVEVEAQPAPVVEAEAEAEVVAEGDVVTKWSWSPSSVIAEEDLFAMPFHSAQDGGDAFGSFAAPTIIVHAPLSAAPVAASVPVEAAALVEQPAQVEPSSTPAAVVEHITSPAVVEGVEIELVPVSTPPQEQMAAAVAVEQVVTPVIEPVVEVIEPVLTPVEPQAAEEEIIVESPAALELQAEVVEAEPSAAIEVEPAVELLIDDTIIPVELIEETVSTPIVAAVDEVVSVAQVVEVQVQVAPAVHVAPVVAPAPVSAPAPAPASSSWSGTVAIACVLLACIVGGLLQSAESAAAPLVDAVAASPRPAAAASKPRRSSLRPATSTPRTTLETVSESTSPFSWTSEATPTPAPAPAALYAPKRVSLSPIQPVRKIHFTPGSAERPLEPPTPAPFESMAARLDSAGNAVQAMRASIDKAAAGGRLHIDIPMALPVRSVRAATARTPAPAPAPKLAPAPTPAPALIAGAPASTAKVARPSRARASTAAPTPAAARPLEDLAVPERRVTRRSTRLA